MVQHCHLEFIDNPCQHSRPPTRVNPTEAGIIDVEIENLLLKRMLEETVFSEGQVISNIFLRKKKNGSYRMILNLKAVSVYLLTQWVGPSTQILYKDVKTNLWHFKKPRPSE